MVHRNDQARRAPYVVAHTEEKYYSNREAATDLAKQEGMYSLILE
jgi:hypothetical protein